MDFFSNTKKENISILISISNGDLHVSVVKFLKKSNPIFLCSLSSSFIGSRSDLFEMPELLLSSLEKTLKNVIKTIWLKLPKKIEEISNVVVSVSSPWFLIRIKDIHFSQKNNFLITNNFLKDILLKEEEFFKRELLNEYSTDTKEHFEIMDNSIVHTKINGYKVAEILGKKTKEFDSHIFSSAISKKIKDKIVNVITKETHIEKEKILFYSLPLVLFSYIRDYFHNIRDFLILNVNSETTDLILVNEDTIKSLVSFPFGKNSIIKKIAHNSKVSFEIAESQLFLSLKNKADDSIVTSVKKDIEDLEKEWSVYFEDTLNNLSNNNFLPKDLFFFGRDEISPIFIDFIKVQKNDSSSSFRKNVQIIEINRDMMISDFLKNKNDNISDKSILLGSFYKKVFDNL